MFKTGARLTLSLSLLLNIGDPVAPKPSFPVPAPSIEINLFAVTDATGTPNTDNPGAQLAFFQPGETVRITFAAANTGDSVPVRTALGIAPTIDHGSLLYDSHTESEDNTSDSPLSNGETDYYSFDWVIPLSTQWGNYDILGSIRSSDFNTVFDETTPGPSTTSFGEGVWRDAFTVGQFGTTVITHGYQLTGSIPSWPGTLASDIRNRITRGRIWSYNRSTSAFVVTTPYSGEAENILVFDWASESNDNFTGYSEAAAEALFTALMSGASGGSPDWSLEHVHLIGHSRGAVVMSETAQRLLAAGQHVDHVTYLDPVWQGAFGQASDFDVNTNHPTLGTRGVAAWNTAGYVDNFYSTDDVHDDFLGIDGSPIEGARNLDLSGRGTGVGHSDTWRWYYGTINLDATSIDGGNVETAWYGGAGLARDLDGFNQSRLGGAVRTSMSGPTTSVSFDWGIEGLVNGDFQRGPQGTASSNRPDPGWDFHGGGGPGVIIGNHLELQDTDEYRTHNRVWVPPAYAGIRYQYDVQAVSVGNPDTLVAYAVDSNGTFTIVDSLVIDGSPASDYRTFSLAAYNADVISLRFELLPGGASVGSLVAIDDVRFWVDAPPGVAINSQVYLEGPYEGFGMMTTTLNDNLPLSQPYNNSPWSYAGSESVGAVPFDVMDWVLVELRSDTAAATMAGRRAALLTDAGQLQDLDGSSWLAFPTVSPGSYHVVVYHRNHASVMSSAKIDMSSGAGQWNFTSAISSAFGTGLPMKPLGDGLYAMFACDVNGDGQITAIDFNDWLVATKALATGYQVSDCNFDSQVTASDFNEWLVNTKMAASSQVPD